MNKLEITINENADFEAWEYKHFISREERVNILTQHRQLAADLPLFKSDFSDGVSYFSYLVLKKEQIDERDKRCT